jgi:hypothetical protein
MRYTLFLLLAFCYLISCNKANQDAKVNSFEIKIRKQAIRVAENHVRDQIKEAKKTISKDGLIVFSNADTKYLIDPSRIIIGEIDQDSNKDAIVPLYFFRDQTLVLTEHLILIKKVGKLVIAKVLDSDMKVLSIKDRVIYVEISKIASDSPYFGCKICKEIVKYNFIGGDTLRIK